MPQARSHDQTGSLSRFAVENVKACFRIDPLNHTTFDHGALGTDGLSCSQDFVVEKVGDRAVGGPQLKISDPLETRGRSVLIRI